ncbi:MAG: SMC family ATPase, partial [Acidimicrobiia bacterium]|nr:SMC family ATPase [Acidimicrobiia bacterium]
MRPVELTVDGFRSYGSPTTFSWEDRGLVGIVGPIGSGKSSILDAMAYALYAKAPAFERDVKRLINQRRDECHVALTFDVEGRRFQVERAMRRKGAAGHALREVTGGETRLVADRARDLDERIEELLGLDFDAFRRSVLLAQNRFAEFLQATPTQRDAVLEGVVPRFGEIAPMRERAKGLLTLAGARLETVALRRRDLASDREALDVATGRIEELGARLARLEAVAEPLAAADEAVAVARRQEEIARERVEEITELAARVPSREQSEPILETSEQATARLAAAAGAAADARERREGARATLTEALDAVGGREGLTEAATLVERATAAAALADRERRRLEEAETSVERRAHALTEAGSAIERASAAAADAAERRERAEGEARAAEQALHEARHRAMALSLRSELTAGEDCPVCEQAVADLPPPGAAPELEDAEAALTAARAAAADAAEEAMRTSTALARAEEAGDAARSAVDTATAGVREAKDAVEEAEGSRRLALEAVEAALGSGDPAEALAGHRAAVGEADAAV